MKYIFREHPLDMLRGMEEKLAEDMADEGVGRVSSVKLTIDPDRGRAIVDIVGEVCEGDIALRIFTGGHSIQAEINSWMEENGIGEFLTDVVRSEGRLYILVASRRGFA